MSQNTRDWMKEIIIAVVIGLIIIQFIKPTIVQGHSMMPTLNERDYIFLSKQAYAFDEPQYGDIIVFHSDLKTAEGQEKMLIKRIVGLPGDVIRIQDGVVFRNEEALDESYTLEHYTSTIMSDITVPEGSLFVMGDNRQGSTDSRDSEVGCVAQTRLVGKAVLRLYPFNKIGFLK